MENLFKVPVVAGKVVLTSGFRVPNRLNHHGVDFGARPRGNPPILAFADGVITKLDWNNVTAGKWLEITHFDGLISTYMHMDTIPKNLHLGVRVNQGQQIGTMGTTGQSTGIHLHFEVRKAKARNGGLNAIDPMPFLLGVEEVRYRTVRDVPTWAQPIIRNLIEIGVISGTGENEDGEAVIDMSHDMMRTLIMTQNMIRNKHRLFN